MPPLFEADYATLLYEDAARSIKAKRSIEDSLRKVTTDLDRARGAAARRRFPR